MIVYFSVLIIICLICLLDNKGNSMRPLIISVVLLYLMITLQDGWGGDSEFYSRASDFYSSEQFSFSDLADLEERHGEVGFKYAMTIIPSYRTVQFFFSTFLCLAIYILLYNFVPRKYWALFFIFIFIDRYALMGCISSLPRNGFAASIFLIGTYFIYKRQRIIYLSLIVFAGFFHKSAWIFLPFFLAPMRYVKIEPVACVAGLIFLALISAIIPESWSNLVGAFLASSDYMESYSHYLDDNKAHFDFTLLVPFVIFWGYVIFNAIKVKGYETKEYLFIFLALFTVIFRLLPGMGLSDRFYFYLDYTFFAGMLVIIDKTKNTSTRFLIIASLLFVYGRWFLDYAGTLHFALHWMKYNPIF